MDRPDILTALLTRVARSPHPLALRGSLVTALFIPERRAFDVDLLALEAASLRELTALVDDLLADGLPAPTREATWVESEQPGWRLRFGEALQVDLGFGDPIVGGTVTASVAGVVVPVVRAETMAAWKAHGIVEFGRGRFRAKDVWDLHAILGRVQPFDHDRFARSLALAFASRQTPLAMADPLLHDVTWGGGRSSTRKWRALARSGLVPAPLPPLLDVVASLRASLGPVFARLAAGEA